MDKNINIALIIVALLAIAFISYALIGNGNTPTSTEHTTEETTTQTDSEEQPSTEPVSEEIESKTEIPSVELDEEEEKKIISTVNFTLSKEANLDEAVKFNNKSKNADSYWWNFGDGNISNKKNPPPHQYKKPGIYTVKLRINGEEDLVMEKDIVIIDNKPADIPIAKNDDADQTQTAEKEKVEKQTLEAKIQGYFNKIADDTIAYTIKKDILDSLNTKIANEKIPVQFIREGESLNKTYYEYYQSLNITGGQKITKVEIISTSKEGEITGLKIIEQK